MMLSQSFENFTFEIFNFQFLANLNQSLPCQASLMVPLNLLTCWSLLCGPWSSFVVSFPLGPYSRFLLALVCGPVLASVLWFPMAHPLVPNGPSSGSQWPILQFPMAHPLVLNGPSAVVPPLVVSLEFLVVPVLVPGPP